MARIILQPNSKGHPGGVHPVAGILPLLSPDERERMRKAAPEGKVIAYGKDESDRKKWDRVREGDPALFYHHWIYFAEGRVALKVRNAKLARFLWGSSGGHEGTEDDRLLFYARIVSTHIPAAALNKVVGYKAHYVLRPFQVVETSRSAALTELLEGGRSLAEREDGRGSDSTVVADVDEGVEGRMMLGLHVRRERSRRLIKAKQADVLTRTGRLSCETCGFDAREAFPWMMLDFAEVHHKLPLGSRKKPSVTRLGDLAILCANCHRMIHRTNPMMTVARFRAALANARG